MTVGTTADLQESRYIIVSDALMLLGVNEAGENIAEADMQLGVRWLNRLVKQWEAKGFSLNTNAYATVFLQYGINEYVLGSEDLALAHWAESPVTQTLQAAAAAGDTALTLESSVALTIGDHIGVVGDDGAILWTTVLTKPTSTTVTITLPLLDDSASGNIVYSYTSRPASGAPVRVLDANIVNQSGQQTSETMMPVLAVEDYFQLTNKGQLGQPINIVYVPKIETGVLNVWPTPNNGAQRLRIHYERSIFNFTGTATTQDLNPIYLNALVYNLAVCLAPSYGKIALLPGIAPLAMKYLEDAECYDQEVISVYLSMSEYRY